MGACKAIGTVPGTQNSPHNGNVITVHTNRDRPTEIPAEFASLSKSDHRAEFMVSQNT